MKFSAILGFALLAQSVSAHYIFGTLITDTTTSTNAIRMPQGVEPFHDFTTDHVRCNVDPSPASETVSVPAGGTIGFKLAEGKKMYHEGPVAIYLGKAPDTAASWDGSGQNWFKIAEWGPASMNPFTFSSLNQDTFTTTIPDSTPSGEYLVRIEQAALHLTGTPEYFVSCAQIKVTNGGNGNPSKVSIPGYVTSDDPSLMINIYGPPYPTSYTCPGPSVWRG